MGKQSLRELCMRSDGWFGKLLSRFQAGIVQDMPSSLEECETCREVDCTHERWLGCQRRMAAEAAAAEAAGLGPSCTNEQLPDLSTPELPEPQAAPQASDPAEAYEQREAYQRRRKISIH